MMNMTVPINVTMNDQVKAQITNGCINMTTPIAINTVATASHGPRRPRKSPAMNRRITTRPPVRSTGLSMFDKYLGGVPGGQRPPGGSRRRRET